MRQPLRRLFRIPEPRECFFAARFFAAQAVSFADARLYHKSAVYAEILPYDARLEEIQAGEGQLKGIILTGGPDSVYLPDSLACDSRIFDCGVPVLGICYGMQLTAYLLGGTVEKAAQREYGRITVTMDDKTSLLSGMSDASSCWLSHTYQVKKCPAGFHPIAHSTNCPVAAMANDDRRIYGVQFHPEVTHSDEGRAVIENFLNICGCVGDWRRRRLPTSAKSWATRAPCYWDFPAAWTPPSRRR